MSRIAAAVLVLGFALPAHADEPRGTPFDRGRVALRLGVGSQSALGHRYFVAGGGAGYYVLDGLELDLDGTVYLGDGPSIRAITPGARYVAQPLVGKWPVIPYGGVFYTHWFLGEPYEDFDTIGARTGVVYLSGRFLLGIGIAYSHVLSDCAANCDQVYPDLSIGVTF
jgi:hypothetical protein